MKAATALLMSLLAPLGFAHASEELEIVRFKELTAKTPGQNSKAVRVWNIKQDKTIRVNLVEMSGELRLHSHPDAAHSLMVMRGKVRVRAGDKEFVIEEGDFISIPAGMPHKYWALEKSVLVSMDAPYYDPRKTIPLE